MTAVIEKGELVIRVPLHDPRPSTSGKTLLVASSGGTVTTSAMVQGKPIKIGVNAFIAK
jgi:hypothetical protein